MGRRSPDQTETGEAYPRGAAFTIDDVEDDDDRGEPSGLALGSEVHDLDALEGVLVAPGSLDALIVAYLLDRSSDEHGAPAPAKTIRLPLAPHTTDRGGVMDRKAELVLYVVDNSESCDRAQANLARALRHYDEREVGLVIRNVSREPLQPGEDQVIVVPTLVLRKPRRNYLAGDVDPDDLDTMLASAGVRRRP